VPPIWCTLFQQWDYLAPEQIDAGIAALLLVTRKMATAKNDHLALLLLLWLLLKLLMFFKNLQDRKDDRVMRPIYECRENFRETLTMPTATFPKGFNGLFFRLML